MHQMLKCSANSQKHITKYNNLHSPLQSSHFIEWLAALDRSVFMDVLFSAPHQYMHIYSISKIDMKAANAVHYINIYIVVCIILNILYLVDCIHGLYRNWIMNGSICESAHLQLIFNAWVAKLQWKPFSAYQLYTCAVTWYPHMRNVFVFGQWEMTEIIIWQSTKSTQIVLDIDIFPNMPYSINYPCYSVYVVFGVKSNVSFSIPLFLSVCVPSLGGLTICFHFLPSESPIFFQMKFISWTNKLISRGLWIRWGIS